MEHRGAQSRAGRDAPSSSRVESADDAEDDPLARAVGIGTATEAPEDPALARLFPDGYTDDPEASADFRRYTEPGLRIGQAAAAGHRAGDSLGEEPHRMLLDAEEAQAWLGALNDIRLVLGERLGVTEDLEELIAALGEDDPRLALLWVYDRLTYLQETLVQALWGARTGTAGCACWRSRSRRTTRSSRTPAGTTRTRRAAWSPGRSARGRPERFVPMVNAARSPTFYEFDSADLLRSTARWTTATRSRS